MFKNKTKHQDQDFSIKVKTKLRKKTKKVVLHVKKIRYNSELDIFQTKEQTKYEPKQSFPLICTHMYV
jgi:hypothetical protein